MTTNDALVQISKGIPFQSCQSLHGNEDPSSINETRKAAVQSTLSRLLTLLVEKLLIRSLSYFSLCIHTILLLGNS